MAERNPRLRAIIEGPILFRRETPSNLLISYATATDPGKKSENNDRYYAGIINQERLGIGVVIDGNSLGADMATDLTSSLILAFNSIDPNKLSDFKYLNSYIQERIEKAKSPFGRYRRQGETTLSMAVLDHDKITIIDAGNSPIIGIKENETGGLLIKQLNTDDSAVFSPEFLDIISMTPDTDPAKIRSMSNGSKVLNNGIFADSSRQTRLHISQYNRREFDYLILATAGIRSSILDPVINEKFFKLKKMIVDYHNTTPEKLDLFRRAIRERVEKYDSNLIDQVKKAYLKQSNVKSFAHNLIHNRDTNSGENATAVVFKIEK